jgi:hypothetical protein
MKLSKASKIVVLIILSGFISFSVMSCKKKVVNTVTPQVTNETIKKEIYEYTYPINSVFDVTNMLIKIEASYIIGITNNTANIEKYFTDQSKIFNLGVYSADLAYSTTYNNKADVQKYFKVIESLANNLSITPAFSKDLPGQIESNLDNKDKLVEIITKMSQDAYNYLNKQGHAEMSYLILAGTVIEGLYLTLNLTESTYQNPEIVKAIMFQKEPLAKLERLMAECNNQELLKSTVADLKSINAIYAQVEGTTSVTRQQVEQLTALINKIRTEKTK